MKIRVLLADDHDTMRECLRNLLKNQPDMEVVAEAENGLTAVQLARNLYPDVIVMDVTMPVLNGIEAARQIIGESSDIKVVALSMHSDKRFVTELFKIGASAYVLKDCALEDLAIAIRSAVKNKTFLSPQIRIMKKEK